MGTAAKHTPGPWKVIPSPHGPKYKCVQYGKDENYASLEMLPEDARLCAASPMMLAALIITAGNIRSLGPAGAIPEPYTVWLSVIEKAIFRATGAK